MGVGAGLYMYDIVVKKFTFAISSPDEFLFSLSWTRGTHSWQIFDWNAAERICLRCDACISGGATWQDLQSFLILEWNGWVIQNDVNELCFCMYCVHDCDDSKSMKCLTVPCKLTPPPDELLPVDEQCQQLLADGSSFYCGVSITTTTTTTRRLYCVECPQYSIRLEALRYLCDCLSGCISKITST